MDGYEDRCRKFLGKPDNYPEPTSGVEVRETHLSCVFLTDDFVYKLKKPLRYDYLDFSTPEARLRNCETEVEINSELAPKVYQGVVTLADDERDGLNLRGKGRALDYLVKMRRLPDDLNLEAQLGHVGPDPDQVTLAARRLARFYVSHPLDGPVDPGTLKRAVEDRVEELGRLPVDCADELTRLRDGLLRRLHDNWQDVSKRRRRDVHGDLRPQHVYLGRKPVFIDRLEFNSGLRLMDPLEELSFFAMECERLGARWIGERFIEVYREMAEETGQDPSSRFIPVIGRCFGQS
jgi:aminoglycoside phosphotransferase family enzyme